MHVFTQGKDTIPVKAAAQRYGMVVNHKGMCRCPFHNDRNPSMKVDHRFHCFGCQADGDVIDFVGRLFNLSPKDAALKLASDFHIRIDGLLPLAVEPKRQTISEQEIRKRQESYAFSELTAYREQLLHWKEAYAPRSPDAELHPRFQKALLHLEQVENDLDVLLMGTETEKMAIIQTGYEKSRA